MDKSIGANVFSLSCHIVGHAVAKQVCQADIDLARITAVITIAILGCFLNLDYFFWNTFYFETILILGHFLFWVSFDLGFF